MLTRSLVPVIRSGRVRMSPLCWALLEPAENQFASLYFPPRQTAHQICS